MSNDFKVCEYSPKEELWIMLTLNYNYEVHVYASKVIMTKWLTWYPENSKFCCWTQPTIRRSYGFRWGARTGPEGQ